MASSLPAPRPRVNSESDPDAAMARIFAEYDAARMLRPGPPVPRDEPEDWAEFALWRELTSSDDAVLFDPDPADRADFRQLWAAIDDDRASRVTS
jgi:hypothetical protein